jgi:hypothetical protein
MSPDVGTYRTTVRLTRFGRAYLDLGQLRRHLRSDRQRQGTSPPDQISRGLGLVGHLAAGTNTISVRVATTLRTGSG